MSNMPDPDYYARMFDGAHFDGESCTYLVVTDTTPEAVAETLGANPEPLRDDDEVDGIDYSAYAFAAIPGGVVALELSGYADPSVETLRKLSTDGRAAAVARSNIQAHHRFGCARNGDVIFDDDEYTFIEDPGQVPEDLAALFEPVWVDLDAEDDEENSSSPLATAMAMTEVITGLRPTQDDLHRALGAGFHKVRSLTYLG